MNDESEIARWINEVFTQPWEKEAAAKVGDWAESRGLVGSVAGDSYFASFPNLPRSDGWLSVSALEKSVILRFERLKGYTPFDGAARTRLIKKMELDGFLQKADTAVPNLRKARIAFAKTPFVNIVDDFGWKLLEWRLGQVADLAENASGAPP